MDEIKLTASLGKRIAALVTVATLLVQVGGWASSHVATKADIEPLKLHAEKIAEHDRRLVRLETKLEEIDNRLSNIQTDLREVLREVRK